MTTTAISPTTKMVREVIANQGQHPNWKQPHHVVGWLLRPPTRHWLLAAFLRRASAQHKCNALIDSGVNAYCIDIRDHVLERLQSLIQCYAMLGDHTISESMEELHLAITSIIEGIERNWR